LDPNIFVVEPSNAVCDFNAPACGDKPCQCPTGDPDCCGPEDTQQCSDLADVARGACADVPEGPRKENCEFDVFVTGDARFAQEKIYTEENTERPQVIYC